MPGATIDPPLVWDAHACLPLARHRAAGAGCVSVNIGMQDFVFDAVNAGYQFVLPRDAVAGVPKEYADAVLDNTLSLLTTMTTTDDVLAAWA